MDYQTQRKKLVDWTRSQLMGFKLKDNVLTGEKPLDRFFTGFLFPVLETEEGLDSDEEDISDPDDIETKPIKKEKRYIPPSSAGFSFYISGRDIRLRIFHNAVCYKKLSDIRNPDGTYTNQRWKKYPLTDNEGEEIEFSPNGLKQYLVFNGKAKIDALWRKHANGYIVTITISNSQKLNHHDENKIFNEKQNEFTLFEIELKCIVEEGNVGAYPSKNKQLLTDEEKEIELRYKDQRIYAIGHGTAVDWLRNEQGQMEIFSDFMPTVEVPQVTADTGGKSSRVLEFGFLSECEQNAEVISKLKEFVNHYELWISAQEGKANNEDEDDKETAKKIIDRIVIAKKRMERGIVLLEQDSLAKTAFAIANKSMLDQMMASDRAKGSEKDAEHYKWRPFQIAFVLLVLESATNEDSHFRDTVDLIWFPTGGGKTEAYLGLMAFLFIYRRLKYPASYGGTVSVMRYTLRLLTAQQFLRACKVISALELIRRKNTDAFGNEPISIGLWVGAASSPNTYKQAKELIQKEQFSKLILNSCPWCGTAFNKNNYIAAEDDFYFTCTNTACDFGKEKGNRLPYNVVDEALYKAPPGLLIATVDKFARLAWEARAASFFGLSGNRPPELIIQDELHLISSALGSIVGLYEVGVDTLLVSRGIRAKYIASTATIKNAEKQIKRLFARDMLVFPPAGLRYDDSYFAKTVPLDKKPGRLYVGYLAPLLSRQNCLEPLAGNLLSAPAKLFKDSEEYLDSWWTQIIYHGSLKGVGNSRTLYQSGIKTWLSKFTMDNLKNDIEKEQPNYIQDKRIKKMDDYQNITEPEIKSIVDKYLPVRSLNVKTLTSNQSAEENAHIFDVLTKERHENESIDVALATNMISVGLDVSRLALMIINGQPLTTAEYIQASSRVGRGDIPGVVFINYYKTQARSLSHYENFRSYHDSFYRFVEPSSLTPFTYQARTRALHAALVIAMRYSGVGLLENDNAELFDPENNEIKKVIIELKHRVSLAMDDKEKINQAHKHIDELVGEWHNEILYSDRKKRSLKYYKNDKASNNLLRNFGEAQGLWSTLQSMRNVENTALIKLLGGVKLNNEK
jgi:hypothetical protein